MAEAATFALAAAALLGSPGPGIAALLAVGRLQGVAKGLPYLGAMLGGLALAAGLSGAGLVAFLAAFPPLEALLTTAALAYLAWLAWSIGSAPLTGQPGGAGDRADFGLAGAFLLGIANPKAFAAFASLFGSFVVAHPGHGLRDTLAKWALIVSVAIVVDLAWLAAGAAIGRIRLKPRLERSLNVAMAAAVILACGATLA